MGSASYGLGWHIRSDAQGRRQVLHGGASDGADVQFTLVPEEKVCVVVLANVTRHFPGAVTEAITNSILAKLLGGEPGDFPINTPPPPPKASGLPGKFGGRWVGKVHTHQGMPDVTLWCHRSGIVEVQLGERVRTSIREGRLDGDAFAGKMDGDVGTDDARRRTHELQWDVTIRGDVLNGTLYATVGRRRHLRLGLHPGLRHAGGLRPGPGPGPEYHRHADERLARRDQRLRPGHHGRLADLGDGHPGRLGRDVVQPPALAAHHRRRRVEPGRRHGERGQDALGDQPRLHRAAGRERRQVPQRLHPGRRDRAAVRDAARPVQRLLLDEPLGDRRRRPGPASSG
jgi:hypothetical protein